MDYRTTHHSEIELHHTIAHIESRLALMDGNSSCDYERALAHTYHELLVRYGRRLVLLQSRRFLLSETPTLIAQRKSQ